MKISMFIFRYLPIFFFYSSIFGVIDFRKDVWPILDSRCIECHKSPYEKNGVLKKPKAGLRLDGAAYIMHGSDDGPVVIVNHPSRSSLYQRVILPEDDADHMPPKGGSLSTRQKEILRMWIAQGVDFGDWVGATDGIENLAERKKSNNLPQASYLMQFDQLAKGVQGVEETVLKEIVQKTSLMVRPLGVGSVLLEAKVVTEPSAVNDQAVEWLMPIKQNIVKVDLRETSITDKSLQMLSTFPRLTQLNLMGTEIDSSSIKYFNGNERLESLNMVDTKVSESISETLLSMPSLEKVYLWKSEFTPAGISLLQKKARNMQVNF
ncbi:MAG: c-type cytochrome domain-containing protein [Opitutales bacterium]|jgi:hypothetical protein